LGKRIQRRLGVGVRSSGINMSRFTTVVEISLEMENLALLESCLAQKVAEFGENHIGVARTLEKLATIHVALGNSEKAITALRKALKIDSLNERLIVKLSEIYFERKEHQKGRDLCAQIAKQKRAPSQQMLLLKAAHEREMHDFVAEESSLRQVLQKLPVHGVLVKAEVLMALGKCKAAKRELDESFQALHEALCILTSNLPKNNLKTALCLERLAQNFAERRLFGEAQAILRRATDMRGALGEDLMSSETMLARLIVSHHRRQKNS